MNVPELVRRYAATLLAAAEETGVLDAVRRDVEGVLETASRSAELQDFLRNPLVAAAVKRRALEAIFAGKTTDLLLNFMRLLAQRRRTEVLVPALAAFRQLVQEREGIVGAEVRAAVPLSEEQRQRLGARLASYTGKEVRLHVQVDPTLRGGAVARVGDTVFDGSLNMHLERLRRRLVGA